MLLLCSIEYNLVRLPSPDDSHTSDMWGMDGWGKYIAIHGKNPFPLGLGSELVWFG